MQTKQLTRTDNAVALSPATSAALGQLSPDNRRMIEAGLQPGICKVETLSAVESLADAVNMAFSISGQRPDDQTTALIVNELYRKLLETYPHCTLEEARTAFRNGVYDAYGEYYGLNVKTFVFFIREYLFSEQRKAAKVAFESARKQARLAPVPEPPYWEPTYWTDERTAQWREITEHAYGWFCQDAILSGFIQEGSFWLLEGEGRIVLTVGQKKALIGRASRQMRTELVKNEGRRHIDEIRSSLEQMKDPDAYPDMKRQLILYAKRLAVLDYFATQHKGGLIKIYEADKTIPDSDRH